MQRQSHFIQVSKVNDAPSKFYGGSNSSPAVGICQPVNELIDPKKTLGRAELNRYTQIHAATQRVHGWRIKE